MVNLPQKLINTAFLIVQRAADFVHTVPIQVAHDIDAVDERRAFSERRFLDGQEYSPVVQMVTQTLDLDVDFFRVNTYDEVLQWGSIHSALNFVLVVANSAGQRAREQALLFKQYPCKTLLQVGVLGFDLFVFQV